MALKVATLRLASLACLVVAALAWVSPTAAFNYGQTGTRSVAASVKADASAYNAPYLPTCNGFLLIPTTCNFHVYNNATSNQTFTVTQQADASAIVTAFSVDGNPASGGVATGNLQNVGQSSTVAVTIRACAPACGTITVDWIVEGSTANVLTSREERVVFTAVYP